MGDSGISMMKEKSYLQIFWPFLLSFSCGRIVLQTDLFMVSRLGSDAIAAFGVPMRVMLLDIIAAFALAPVVSVWVSGASSREVRKERVEGGLQLGLLVGLICLVLGLFCYPQFLKLLSLQESVKGLAQQAVFWLTLAIPTRLLQFTGSMILHGAGLGHRVIRVSLIEICLNLFFNYLFIFHLNRGFQGSYESTLLCSFLSCTQTLFILKQEFGLQGLFRLNSHVTSFLPKVFTEALRLVSEKGAGFVLLWLFTAPFSNPAVLPAFSVASEVLFFLTVPFVASMRASAIVLARWENLSLSHLFKKFKNILLTMTLGALLGAFLIFFFSRWIGASFYALQGESLHWWYVFCLFLALMLPVKVFDSFQRAIFQSKQKLKFITKVDLVLQWLVLVPIVALGVYQQSPHFVWAAYLIVEIGSLIVLTFKGKNIFQEASL